jgi:hypothetical protein
MGKIFKQKNFNNFVWTPLVAELIYIKIFAFKITLRCLQPDIFRIIFHRCLTDTGGKFSAGVADIGGNFPPASFRPAANLPPASLILVANLPPVSLTPVVQLDLRISLQIFEKI